MGSCFGFRSLINAVSPRNAEENNAAIQHSRERQVDGKSQQRPFIDFGVDQETWVSFKQKWQTYRQGIPESLAVPHLLFRCASEQLCDLLLISDPSLIQRSEDEVLYELELNVVMKIDDEKSPPIQILPLTGIHSNSVNVNFFESRVIEATSSVSDESEFNQKNMESEQDNDRTNLEFIWSNFQNISDEMFQYLAGEDLLNVHDTCSSGTNAVASYIRTIRIIYHHQGQLGGMSKNNLQVILPYTKMLQTFTTSFPLEDEDISTLLANNSKLREFSYASIPQFYRILANSSTSKYAALTVLNLVNESVEKVEPEDTANFFETLSKFCSNLKQLWVETNDDVINEDSLRHLGQFSKLHSLKLEDVVISGRLSCLLSGCRRLKRIHLSVDVIGEDTLQDIANCCTHLEHLTVTAYDTRPGDEERDFAAEATDIILANRKLQSFNFDSGDFVSMNDRTLDAMTEHLENMKEISFATDAFFSEIGQSFTRFLNKFQNLSKLEVKLENGLSQDWFDVIASKCSNLVYLSLTEYDVEGSEERSTRLSRIDVSQIFENNPKLTEMEI